MRGAPTMKGLALAFVLVGLGITGATADDNCRAQAVANKFRGDEFKSFMANCKALMEIVCQGRAIDQKVSDDGKDSFIKKCVKDAVGR
jgi:hypothetical protein